MRRSYIPNMTCGGCVQFVTKALLSIDPPACEARDDSGLDESALRVVLSEAGYPDKQFPETKRGI